MFTGVCTYLHTDICIKTINVSINGMHQHWLSWFNAVLGQHSRYTVRKQEMVPNTSHFAIHHRETEKNVYNSTGTSFTSGPLPCRGHRNCSCTMPIFFYDFLLAKRKEKVSRWGPSSSPKSFWQLSYKDTHSLQFRLQLISRQPSEIPKN